MKLIKIQIRKSLMLVLGMVLSFQVYAADETFTASIQILTALSVTEQTALAFPTTEASTAAQTVVVAPTDSGAATFDIAGESNYAVTASIVESSLTMTNQNTSIVVDTFTFGGNLSSTGTGTLSASGGLTGARVGATANIPANPKSGSYSGNLTFRVVYN